jgi:hypothetical protein
VRLGGGQRRRGLLPVAGSGPQLYEMNQHVGAAQPGSRRAAWQPNLLNLTHTT